MASSIPSVSASLPSAESSIPRCKYDVFLSFRGEDTREGFMSHLYDELRTVAGIKTFMDDQGLKVGMRISSNLFRAIEESRYAIVVLSPKYATSTWCLDELTHMFRSMEGKDRILPLFYHVVPSDVRNQRGSFQEALTKHEEMSTQEEVLKEWRVALRRVADLKGWHTENYKSERELVKDIVKDVSNKIKSAISIADVEASEPSSPKKEASEPKRHAMDESLEDFEKKHFSVGPYGSKNGGKKFDDEIYSTVRQLVLHYDKHSVNYIQIEYDLDGMSHWSDKHGDPYLDGKTATITLDYPDEFLTSIHGCYEKIWCMPTQITSLTFKSNKETYGPFGRKLDRNDFSIQKLGSKIVGFHGRSSSVTGLRAIGAHLKPL